MKHQTPLARSPREYFRQEYGDSPNFMTPELIRHGSKGRFVYELSQGEGFKHEPIYGVTVLLVNDDDQPERMREISQCCHSRREADQLINSLGDLHP